MKNRTTSVFVNHLKLNEIFVFGSNLAGRHGLGAALTAKQKFGAINGQPAGLMGRSYGIPFKDGRHGHDPAVRKILPLKEIEPYIKDLIQFAKANPHNTFLVPEIGCGLARYTPEQVAPLFTDAIDVSNIHLPASFWKVLNVIANGDF